MATIRFIIRGFKMLAYLTATFCTGFVLFELGAGIGMAFGNLDPLPQVETVEPPSDEQELKRLIAEIPNETDIPKEVIDTVLLLESGGRFSAKRFEPHHLDRYGKKISSDPETAREYASSHSVFQLMAWHLKFDLDGSRVDRGEWYDLYKPEVSVREFKRVMGACLQRHAGKSRYEQFSGAFECYNGSKIYAQKAMNHLARLAVEKL